MSETPPVVPAWAAPLRDKYAEMLRLRRGDRDGSIVDPRPAMAALAAAFPGALREIDRLTLDELTRREQHLGRVVASLEPPAPWAVAMAGYHRWLRAALAIKRWLGRQRAVDDELLARFEREAQGDAWLAWRDALAELARPPSGRLLPLVLARLAEETGCEVASLRELLFGEESPGADEV